MSLASSESHQDQMSEKAEEVSMQFLAKRCVWPPYIYLTEKRH